MKIIKPSDLSYLEHMVNCQLKLALETEDLNLNRELLTRGITEVIQNPKRGKYYLALDDNDEFMGMLLTMPEWSDWRCADVLWIHSVYVLKEYRGKGIYKQMYQYLQNIVRESDDYAGLRLYVDKTNTHATKVYQKLAMSDEHYNLFEWLK